MGSIIDYIAHQCVKHNTVIARAFRRALGIETDTIASTPTVEYRNSTYDGIMECFNQTHGVHQ